MANYLQRIVRRLNARPRGSAEPIAPPPLPTGRPDRRSIMDHAFEFVAKSDLDGCYMEFGCYQGASFTRAYEAYHRWLALAETKNWRMSRQRMFAFDSFCGLPDLKSEDQLTGYEVFAESQYACSQDDFRARLQTAGVDLDLVRCVEGFYDSLTGETKTHLDLPLAAVIHIDCDLYSSARDVLRFVEDRVQDGTIMLFDDYYCYRGNPQFGVRRAFEQWLKQTGIQATVYFNYSWAGCSFILNRLTKTPLDGRIKDAEALLQQAMSEEGPA